MQPPGAPKATKEQRQLQVAEMRIANSVAEKQKIDPRDLLIVIKYTMTYPSASKGSLGMEHITDEQWAALDQEFEWDTIPRLSRAYKNKSP